MTALDEAEADGAMRSAPQPAVTLTTIRIRHRRWDRPMFASVIARPGYPHEGKLIEPQLRLPTVRPSRGVGDLDDGASAPVTPGAAAAQRPGAPAGRSG